MKAFNRRLFASLVMVGMLGLAGCGPDNETEGQNLGAKAGDPGKANPDAIPKETTAPPRTSADRAKQGPSGTQKQFQKGGGAYPAGK